MQDRQADVKLLESSPDGFYPIFSFPQPSSAGITLLEVVDAVNTPNFVSVDWTISGLPIMSGSSFRLEQLEGWHRIRVHQDENRGDHPNVFEMWADNEWLGDHPIPGSNHLFDTGPQTFYIGRAPDLSHGLYGEISHLDFDPNNTCGGC
jgi:hypothetical protein